MIETGYVPKQHVKSHFVNGKYDLFNFTALLLHCSQNTIPPYTRIAIARSQGIKTKALLWVGNILHYLHPFYNLTNKDYVAIISLRVWKKYNFLISEILQLKPESYNISGLGRGKPQCLYNWKFCNNDRNTGTVNIYSANLLITQIFWDTLLSQIKPQMNEIVFTTLYAVISSIFYG